MKINILCIHRTILAAVFFICSVYAQSKVTQDADGKAGTISFSTPNLSDAEAHSPWMPDQLKCDACTAVAYQFWKSFHRYNKKRKSFKYNLPESDIVDLAEKVCETQETWESYGMKEIDGEKRLSGPGLEAADVPGVTAGGGKWPGRLRDMCDQYIGDLGEMAIYAHFKRDPDSHNELEEYLCRGPGLRGECVKSTEKPKPKKDEKKEEKKKKKKKQKKKKKDEL